MLKAKKTTESLTGVHCDVASCVYNDTDRMCHADHIQVTNQKTHTSDGTDTFCGTFEAK